MPLVGAALARIAEGLKQVPRKGHLGGAEFRLPLLIGAFRFGALQAVILNKAMGLVVVATALPFRAPAVPFSAVPFPTRPRRRTARRISWGHW